MHLLIAIVSFGLASLLQAEETPTPPKMWEIGLQNRHQELWDRLRKNDGKVDASEVIEWMYKNHLSHHDGDSQKYASYCLIQLKDDPLLHLRKMMTDAQPERRAYAVLIAGMLGDTRLTEDIKRLTGDTARLGQFEDEWFWGTVADVANEASRSFAEGRLAAFLRAEGEAVAAWLPPTKLKAEQDASGNRR